jgi:hypothetical protein
MLIKTLLALIILMGGIQAVGQTKSYESPRKNFRALIVPVGAPGYENHESRLEIRGPSGTLVLRRDFGSRDHNHGEGVGHAEWTSDGRFFVFTTSSSGGHQPWHLATYFYSVRSNRLYSLDALVGAITSDFKLRGEMLLTTRLGVDVDDQKPVAVQLDRWR